MKSLLRTVLISIATGLACLPAISFAGGMNPKFVADRLDQVVHLSASQRAQAVEIFTTENAALQAIPSTEDRLAKGGSIRQAARAKIRDLLTPEQKQIYDSTPQNQGGGQRMNPTNMTERLDRTVMLTDAQIAQVATIYTQESRAMSSLTPEERTVKGAEIARAVHAQTRAILTPEQRTKWDANPTGVEDLVERAYVKNFITTFPAIVAQVGAVAKATLSSSMLGSSTTGTSMKGRYTYLVAGNISSETLKVYWERSFPDAPLSIVKIVQTGDPSPATVQFENDFWQSSNLTSLSLTTQEQTTRVRR